MGVQSTIKGKLRVLKNKVLVERLEAGESKSKGGIVIMNDNMKESGIRSRWAKVYAVGPEVTEIQPGQWIRIEHGRWTFGFKHEDENGVERMLHQVDWPDKVDLVCDEFPGDIVPVDFN